MVIAYIVPISSSMARKVFIFTDDISPPVLNYFNLNIEEGVISITFNEVVNSSSFDPTKLIVTNNEASHVRLVNSTTRGVNGLTIAVILSDHDLYRLKIEPEVATRQTNTYLYVEQGAISDAVGNQIKQSQPKKVAEFIDKSILHVAMYLQEMCIIFAYIFYVICVLHDLDKSRKSCNRKS